MVSSKKQTQVLSKPFLKNLRGIVFDLHGVLISSFPVETYYSKVYRFFPKDCFEKLKEKFSTGAMLFIHYGLKEEYIKLLDSLPVSSKKEKVLVDLLDKLKGKVPLYIGTNTSRKSCINSLLAAGYNSQAFERIVTLEDVTLPKPNEEIYRKLGVGPGFLVIGDRISDVRAAKKLGAQGIVVKSPREVVALLQKIVRGKKL